MNRAFPTDSGDRWVAPSCYESALLEPALAWVRLRAGSGRPEVRDDRRPKAYGVRPRRPTAELARYFTPSR